MYLLSEDEVDLWVVMLLDKRLVRVYITMGWLSLVRVQCSYPLQIVMQRVG